ncbi:hypothetical protein [uncultured Ruminococcus sp.]|uniref:hypothetical protein n=1 Tax=uncultured Ruminococcus sp. TaxID=165186 RepID=UPI0025E37FA6|nr:hypothetical protein [uncultured Ruminococcus sp.]
MEINKNGNRVAVHLNENELNELGLSYEVLRDRELTAMLFLAAMRAQLTAEGRGDIYGDIRISRQDDGVMLTVNVCVSPEYYSVPAEVISRCHVLDTECELYRTASGYALVHDGCDPVEAAIIKEHGRLICNAPVKLLYPLAQT